MKKYWLFFLLFCLCFGGSGSTKGEEVPPLFPFLISYEGADNVSSMAHLLSGPAGKNGFVRIENGRFVDDVGLVKLHATNLTGPANFPTHEQSDKLADRLARFGINCVRLHYFDAAYGTFKFPAISGIFKGLDAWQDAPQLPEFDPERRDRQDYLIAALKKKGIYVNMNLHVARNPKGIDIFDPTLIALQKEYARKLLTHVNPYTGLAYVEEPAIAVIEINNENALFNNYGAGMAQRMKKEYQEELQKQWNEWLKQKYATTAALHQAWEWKQVPLHDEQIPEGKFDEDVPMDGKIWRYQDGQTNTAMDVADGRLTVRVSKAGETYFPKLLRQVQVKKGEIYTLKFFLRCIDGKPGKLGLAVADAQEGWRSLGLFTTYNVGRDWQLFQYTFEAIDDSDQAEVQMTRFTPGVYEMGEISFQSGMPETALLAGTLEEGTVPVLRTHEFAPACMKKDFAKFLTDVELRYWMGLYSYLRKDLKAKQLISGTQLGYSPAPIMAELDYVDSHSYWCHPSPVSKEWKITNRSMVNSFGCVLGLANQRVLGKPYTCSEYNHPFPNFYGAEGQPMLRVMGALQGWDGVFEYTYNHEPDFEPTQNTYFFSMIARTDVLAHIPACAAIYLRGDVREAQETAAAAFNEEKYWDRLAGSLAIHYSTGNAGFDSRLAMIHKVGISLDAEKGANPEDYQVGKMDVLVSDTGEVTWNRELPEKNYWTVNTANTKLFSGFPEGRTIDLGNVQLKIGKTRMDWATLSMTSQNATGFGENGKANILLAATGYCENEGMKVERVSESQITLSDWGKGTILCEGIPATLTLDLPAERVKCFALDPHGERKADVPITSTDGKATLAIDPQYQTIWYEIEISAE